MFETAISFYLEIPLSLCLNINDRDHWAVKARKTRQLRHLGRHHAVVDLREALIDGFSPEDKTHVVVTFIWPDYRRRDVHNWMPTVKAILDGVVDSGFIKDDSDKYLSGPDLRVAKPSEWQLSRTPRHLGMVFDFRKDA